jgi:G3E family GTPase
MTELLVVTGLEPVGVERVLSRIRTADPDAVVIHHKLDDVGGGIVRRRTRDRRRDDWETLQLAHGCVSCTLRLDLLPLVKSLAGRVRRIVLHLDPVLEPEQVCWALQHVVLEGSTVGELVDLRGVVTALDARTWLEDATGDEPVGERGLADLPDDDRTVAQVVVGQAEFADLIVHTGTVDAWDQARTDAVLARLAPTALRAHVAGLDDDLALLRRAHPEARRGDPDDVHASLLRGSPPLDADCGVRLLAFSARRPFHPDRLHDAIDLLLEGVVRVRGRIWLATRPSEVLWLESAGGGLRIGGAGTWLDGQAPDAWEAVPPERAAIASLGWHPRYGDRAQDVVVLAHALDADGLDAVRAALQGALLTDAELESDWAALPDPFGFAHTDPCGEPAGPSDRAQQSGLARGEES